MKVEIEITKKDLRSILCAAIRNYYCDAKMYIEPLNTYPWQHDRYDDHLFLIRDACDVISDLCDMIGRLDTVDDNDAVVKIVFDPSDDDKDEQK